MTEISKMIETDAMTEREISPHSVHTTRNRRMAQASPLACIVTRQSKSPLTALMLLILLKGSQFCLGRGCASIAQAPTKLKIDEAKWLVKNVTRSITCRFATAFKVLKGLSEGLLTAHQRDKLEVVYPVVLVKINRVKNRALLDTGAGSSYASAQLINA